MVSGKKAAVPQEAEMVAPPLQIEVAARVITPIDNLVGFASVKFNDVFVVEGFKILQGEKGLFVGMPSKPDNRSNTGYRDTAKPITAAFRNELIEVVVGAYHAEVEKLQSRVAAVAAASEKQPSIQKQLADGAVKAAKENASRSALVKEDKSQNAER